ncbi:unnamed protein product [Zymoseptoria tritici ST99CH_1E4]|uniref:Uncharacterized protein n=1 Tax=Zymoseptoria tritici ST99CH_1E4 TaxID=1276532 RepID=A0A2H1GZ72_ZYMTR|nr:unnamed protein product [Zymoseptoria tritici ST99CH_1E4]
MTLDENTMLRKDQTWFLGMVSLGIVVVFLCGLLCRRRSPASPRRQLHPLTIDLGRPLEDSTTTSTGVAHLRANSTARSQPQSPHREKVIKRLIHVETHDVKRRPSETVTSILNGRYSSGRGGIKMLEGEHLRSITQLRLHDQTQAVERITQGDALHGSGHSKSSASTISPGDEGQNAKAKDTNTGKPVEKTDSGAFALQPPASEAGEQHPHASVSEWAARQFSNSPSGGSFDLGGLQRTGAPSTVTIRSEDDSHSGGETVALTSQSESVASNDELDPIPSVDGSTMERIIANNTVIDVKDRSASILSMSDTDDLGPSSRCHD